MAFHNPQHIAEIAVLTGTKKAGMTAGNALILGFLGGAFIALGFLLDIRVTSCLPKEWGTLNALLGGAVFPIGLILIVMAGGELLTGNMMALPIAVLAKRATVRQLLRNWGFILVSNFIGAIFVPVVIGNAIRGGLFVAFIYWMVHKKSLIQEKPGMRKAG